MEDRGVARVLLVPWNLLRSFWLEAALVLGHRRAARLRRLHPDPEPADQALAAKGAKDEQYRWLDQRAQRIGPALGVIVIVA